MESEQESANVPQSILVVDDEPQVCEIISDALSSHGHKVDTAPDGYEAMKRIKKPTSIWKGNLEV